MSAGSFKKGDFTTGVYDENYQQEERRQVRAQTMSKISRKAEW